MALSELESKMTDEIDVANDYEDRRKQQIIDSIRRQAQLKKGREGDCEFCGEWSSRLINDACAPCRDKYKLD